MENQEYENKCQFCSEESEYFDFNDKGLIHICKKHLRLEASS